MLRFIGDTAFKSIKRYKRAKKQLCALHQAGWRMGFPDEFNYEKPKHMKGVK